MGSSQSAELRSSEEEEEEEEEESLEEDEDIDDIPNHHHNPIQSINGSSSSSSLYKKLLQQEPEILPYHASSASPLSPQLSTQNTPRNQPSSIKVWDPYNVLAPPNQQFRTFATTNEEEEEENNTTTEVFLMSHGECHMNLRPDLIGGRCKDAALTPNGKRQARALAVYLKSQGVTFNQVYTSNLDRGRETARAVCQDLNFPEDHIQASDSLVDMSHGEWEGCHRSEIFTPETLILMERLEPDFCAPSGESLRQVEFRMMEFINALRGDTVNVVVHPPQPQPQPNWELLLHRPRQVVHRKKSGKSRLQIVTSGGQEADDEMSPRQTINHSMINNQGGGGGEVINVVSTSRSSGNNNSSSTALATTTTTTTTTTCVGVFSHCLPIKCVVTGILGCSTGMAHKICIDDSSITVIQHSPKKGWKIKRMNETSHLRIM